MAIHRYIPHNQRPFSSLASCLFYNSLKSRSKKMIDIDCPERTLGAALPTSFHAKALTIQLI